MKHAANEETRGAGAGSAARDAPLSSRVVGLGGTACWPAGRSVLIDSFGLASSAMARVVALPNGLFVPRGVARVIASERSRKSEARPNFWRSLFLATGPTECSCTPSNLSELVELVNGVTEIRYGKYNKADHEKSRITSKRQSFLVCRRAVVVTNAVADAPGISQAETSHALLATRAHTPT